MSRRAVISGDGTRLSSWSNDGAGVPVVLSNGLGAPVEAWPAVIDQVDTYRVVSWDHRGLGGSQRPGDEARITVADHRTHGRRSWTHSASTPRSSSGGRSG